MQSSRASTFFLARCRTTTSAAPKCGQRKRDRAQGRSRGRGAEQRHAEPGEHEECEKREHGVLAARRASDCGPVPTPQAVGQLVAPLEGQATRIIHFCAPAADGAAAGSGRDREHVA